MVHLYALVDHPARLPPLAGVEGAALTAAEADGVDAIFSAHEGAASPATDEAVLAHARVVEEIAAANAAVLPARFPGRYEDERALLDAVRGRAAGVREALGRVRGCVELGVRVVPQGERDEPPTSGAEYMRARLARVRDAERVADELDDAVGPIARAGTRSVAATPELVLSAAYLVPADDADAFRAAVEEAAASHPDLVYVRVGPWPPYSFALVDGEAP
jgi:Gas vesicle synthesis protein GvpL/GvpF